MNHEGFHQQSGEIDQQDRDHVHGSPIGSPAEGSATAPAHQTQDPDVLEVSGTSASVIASAAIYYCTSFRGRCTKRKRTQQKAVDDNVVPNGFRREGARDDSFMCSLLMGVFVSPAGKSDKRCKYSLAAKSVVFPPW